MNSISQYLTPVQQAAQAVEDAKLLLAVRMRALRQMIPNGVRVAAVGADLAMVVDGTDPSRAPIELLLAASWVVLRQPVQEEPAKKSRRGQPQPTESTREVDYVMYKSRGMPGAPPLPREIAAEVDADYR